MNQKITSALISVFNKEKLAPLVHRLDDLGVRLHSTGGTLAYIDDLGVPVTAIEDLTGYPAILGGRVKTLHPKVFGGILNRRGHLGDEKELAEYQIPNFDLVVVDLYPFEETVAAGGSPDEIIEKIDIGGVSLIRAAAKNYQSTWIISNRAQYLEAVEILSSSDGVVDEAVRKRYAATAFAVSSHYDTAIYDYLAEEDTNFQHLRLSRSNPIILRYGENPHQKGAFFGDLDSWFVQLNGKALSYNNLLDLEAAVRLMVDLNRENKACCAILKHNNACGVAKGTQMKDAYAMALAADPLSAFGGVIIANQPLDMAAAKEMNSLFFEILIAPAFDPGALELLKSKKNRIILRQKCTWNEKADFRSLLGGVLYQESDRQIDSKEDIQVVTQNKPTQMEEEAMLFASVISKHSKSNTIVLATNHQMIASGVGETSRVDALKHALEKAKHFGLELKNAAMASDAFFPFPDCVEIAHNAGVRAVIQPGGSVKDDQSIDFCNRHGMTMVFTGYRHFKH